jgi:hypothetical protein
MLPVIIVAVVALAAGGYFLMNSGSNPLVNNSPEAIVQNALSGRGSVKCEYDEEGKHIITYVKGEKMRTDATGGEEGNGSMIFKDNTSWTWDSATKQGFTFKAPEVSPAETETEDDNETEDMMEDSEEMKADVEKYKDSCKNENIPDSTFEPPSDVTFQDYSQMMQQQMNQVPSEYQQYMER